MECFLFVGFLFFDFNRLASMQEANVNDWSTGLQLSISLYLDIANLLIELLAAMDN